MKLLEGIETADLALYLKKERTLIVGDVHIGFEEALNKQGILVPRFHLSDVLERLGMIFEKVGKVDTFAINGDLKHEFGTISEQEWRDTLKFIDFASKKCKRIAIVKGNHDVILGPIARKRGIELVHHLVLGENYLIHGDKIPDDSDFKAAKNIIIGNEHPAVSVRYGARSELFKCFLREKWKGKNLIVMPSFNPLTIGSDVMREQMLSPFLKRGIMEFEAFIVADKVYDFGKLRNLR